MLRNGKHIYKSICQKQQQLTRKNYVLQVSLKAFHISDSQAEVVKLAGEQVEKLYLRR